MKRLQLSILFSGLVLIAIIVTLLGSHFLQPVSTTAATACPQDWYNSDDPSVRERCGQEKRIRANQQMQQEQAAATLTPYTQKWPGFTPQVLAKPTDMIGPKEIPLINVAGGPPEMRAATSVWFLDYVSNSDQTMWSELYLIAVGGDNKTPTHLHTIVLNKFSEDMSKNEHLWTAPANTGPITITAGSGWPQGVVTFKTAAGTLGTFNLGSATWSLKP